VAQQRLDNERKRYEVERVETIEKIEEYYSRETALEVAEVRRSLSDKYASDLDLEIEKVRRAEEEKRTTAIEEAKKQFQEDFRKLKQSTTKELADAESTIEQLRRDKTRDIASEVEIAKTHIEQKFQRETKLLKEHFKLEQQQAEAGHSKDLQALRTEHAAREQDSKAKLLEEISSLNVRLRELSELQQKERVTTQETHRQNVEEMCERHHEQLIRVRSQLDSTIAMEKKRMEALLESKLETLRLEHEEAMLRAKVVSRNELRQELVPEYETKIDDLKYSLTSALDTVNQAEQEKLDAMSTSIQTNQNAMQRLTEQFANHMTAVAQEHEHAVESLKASFSRTSSPVAANSSPSPPMLRIQLDQKDKELERLRQENLQLQNSMATASSGPSSSLLRAQLDQKDQELERLRQETLQLRNSMKIANSGPSSSLLLAQLGQKDQELERLRQETLQLRNSMAVANSGPSSSLLSAQLVQKDQEIGRLKQENMQLQSSAKQLKAERAIHEQLLAQEQENYAAQLSQVAALSKLNAAQENALNRLKTEIEAQKRTIAQNGESRESSSTAERQAAARAAELQSQVELKNLEIEHLKRDMQQSLEIVSHMETEGATRAELIERERSKSAVQESEKEALAALNRAQEATIEQFKTENDACRKALLEAQQRLNSADRAGVESALCWLEDRVLDQIIFEARPISPAPLLGVGTTAVTQHSGGAQTLHVEDLVSEAPAAQNTATGKEERKSEMEENGLSLLHLDHVAGRMVLPQIEEEDYLPSGLATPPEYETKEKLLPAELGDPVYGCDQHNRPTPLGGTKIKDIHSTRANMVLLQLSDEEKEKFQEAFVAFDKDGSGSIDVEELETVMKSLGMNPSKQEVQDMIDEVDDDNSGEIDMEEFLEMMVKDKAKSAAGGKSSGMASVVMAKAREVRSGKILKGLTKKEREVFDAINLARMHPREMKAAIEHTMENIDAEGNLTFDWGVIETVEGRTAYEEAAEFLSTVEPLGPCILTRGLINIAKALADAQQGEEAHIEHADVNMVSSYGKVLDYVDFVEYGPWQHGGHFIISLIVDDGNKSRDNRNRLFHKSLEECGMHVKDHAVYGQACILSACSEFVPKETLGTTRRFSSALSSMKI
jgi:hypothetical protein